MTGAMGHEGQTMLKKKDLDIPIFILFIALPDFLHKDTLIEECIYIEIALKS